MRLGDRSNDVQPKAGALDLLQASGLHAVEAVEDALELLARNSDSSVLYAHPHRVWRWCGDRHRYPDPIARILDRIVEQVADDGPQLFSVALHDERVIVVSLECNCVCVEVMPDACELHTLGGQRREVDGRPFDNFGPLAGCS